jgi:hypothetical protein
MAIFDRPPLFSPRPAGISAPARPRARSKSCCGGAEVRRILSPPPPIFQARRGAGGGAGMLLAADRGDGHDGGGRRDGGREAPRFCGRRDGGSWLSVQSQLLCMTQEFKGPGPQMIRTFGLSVLLLIQMFSMVKAEPLFQVVKPQFSSGVMRDASYSVRSRKGRQDFQVDPQKR